MSFVLSIALLVICGLLLAAHFLEIKNSHASKDQ
jgi:hypothetical protein